MALSQGSLLTICQGGDVDHPNFQVSNLFLMILATTLSLKYESDLVILFFHKRELKRYKQLFIYL